MNKTETEIEPVSLDIPENEILRIEKMSQRFMMISN